MGSSYLSTIVDEARVECMSFIAVIEQTFCSLDHWPSTHKISAVLRHITKWLTEAEELEDK